MDIANVEQCHASKTLTEWFKKSLKRQRATARPLAPGTSAWFRHGVAFSKSSKFER